MARGDRSSETFCAGGEVRALTGLRGVAACYVVLYHMLQDLPFGGLGGTVLRHGYLAVDLFFVLSGFVLALVHGRDTFDGAGYRLFLRKRFARIYPLYAAVTFVVVLLMVGVDRAAISPERLLVNVVLLQGWGAGASLLAPAWSLSAECGAYLLFPLLAAPLLWGSRGQALVGATLAFAVLIVLPLAGPVARSGPLDLYQAHSVAPLLRCLCGFTLGLAAFRLSQIPAARAFLAAPRCGAFLGLNIAAALAWHGCDLVVAALLVPFIAALATAPTALASRALATPLVHRLGVLSFSIYLVHFPIREWLRAPLALCFGALGLPHATLCATALACAATLAFATLTYRLIEVPARSMVRDRLRLAPTPS